MRHNGTILTCLLTAVILAASLFVVTLFGAMSPTYKNTLESFSYQPQEAPLQWQPATDAPVLYPWRYYNETLVTAIDAAQRTMLEQRKAYTCLSALWAVTTGSTLVSDKDTLYGQLVMRSVSDLDGTVFFFLKGDSQAQRYADAAFDAQGQLLYWAASSSNSGNQLPHEIPFNSYYFLDSLVSSDSCRRFMMDIQTQLAEFGQAETAAVFSKLTAQGIDSFSYLFSGELMYLSVFGSQSGSLTLIYDWSAGQFTGFCL